MICSYCGGVMPDNFNFCGYCGKKLGKTRSEGSWCIIEAHAGYDRSGFADLHGVEILVGEIGLRNQGEDMFVSISEMDGVPSVFKCPMSTFEYQISESQRDTAFWNQLNDEYYVDYATYSEMFDEQDPVIRQALMYVIYMMHAGTEEEHAFIEETMGKDILEIRIPELEE